MRCVVGTCSPGRWRPERQPWSAPHPPAPFPAQPTRPLPGGRSVSEIVGGDHSTNYAGLGFDINYINGRHVGEGAPHQGLMAACRKLGATEVLGPGDAGHSRHIHCGWPR